MHFQVMRTKGASLLLMSMVLLSSSSVLLMSLSTLSVENIKETTHYYDLTQAKARARGGLAEAQVKVNVQQKFEIIRALSQNINDQLLTDSGCGDGNVCVHVTLSCLENCNNQQNQKLKVTSKGYNDSGTVYVIHSQNMKLNNSVFEVVPGSYNDFSG